MPYAGSPETVSASFSGRTVVPSSAPMSLGGFQLHLLVATTLTLHTALISLFVTADRLAVQHVILLTDAVSVWQPKQGFPFPSVGVFVLYLSPLGLPLASGEMLWLPGGSNAWRAKSLASHLHCLKHRQSHFVPPPKA